MVTQGGFKLFRVLRWGQHNHSGWMCGICRSVYKTEREAQVCLERCTKEAKVEFRSLLGSTLIHQCPLCAKRYVHESDARICASQCLEKLELPQFVYKKVFEALYYYPTAFAKRSVRPLIRGKTGVYADKLLQSNWNQPSPIAPIKPSESPNKTIAVPPPKPQQAPQPLPVAALPPLKPKTAPSQAETLKHSETVGAKLNAEPPKSDTESRTLILEAVDIGEDVSSSPSVEQAIFRLPNQKPFKRMGARYECSACHAQYFTKADVEACFFSHPLKDEV